MFGRHLRWARAFPPDLELSLVAIAYPRFLSTPLAGRQGDDASNPVLASPRGLGAYAFVPPSGGHTENKTGTLSTT